MRCGCWKFPPHLPDVSPPLLVFVRPAASDGADHAGDGAAASDLSGPAHPAGGPDPHAGAAQPAGREEEAHGVHVSQLQRRRQEVRLLLVHLSLWSFFIQFLSLRVLRVLCVLVSGLARWGRGNTSATSPDVRRPSGKRLCSERMCACTPASGPSSAAGFSAANASRAATSCSDTPGRTQVRLQNAADAGRFKTLTR